MKEDLRVKKTQQNIENNFIKLLKKQSFKDISVKSLILECQINRSTFYRNYEDKYDLLNKITDKLLDQFYNSIYPEFIWDAQIKLKIHLLPLIDYFDKNKNILIVYYNSVNYNSLPINIFEKMLSIYSSALLQEMLKHYALSKNQVPMASYYTQAIASNILTAIRWIHVENINMTKEELIQMIETSITKGVIPSMYSQFKL